MSDIFNAGWDSKCVELTNTIDDLRAELARRNEIITRLKEDAERLLEFGGHIPTGVGICRANVANGSFCVCGLHEAITLHRALMKELEDK